MKALYSKPDMVVMAVMQDGIICTSRGIDPTGTGQDFSWGNETGINPGGSGNDFNWGN